MNSKNRDLDLYEKTSNTETSQKMVGTLYLNYRNSPFNYKETIKKYLKHPLTNLERTKGTLASNTFKGYFVSERFLILTVLE